MFSGREILRYLKQILAIVAEIKQLVIFYKKENRMDLTAIKEEMTKLEASIDINTAIIAELVTAKDDPAALVELANRVAAARAEIDAADATAEPAPVEAPVE